MSTASTSIDAVQTLDPLPAGTRLQEFVIERAIGIGGFGIVYQANDSLLNRTVAIKEYMPTSVAARTGAETVSPRSAAFAHDFDSGKAMFIDEARMLARFKHPALIEVFRYWEQNGTAYMATPFYKGHTLKEQLRLNPGVPHEAQLKLILMPVLDALEHMHREQVYHRDISPDNIMVTEDGTPILLDLGAARRIEEHGAQAFTVLVKPGYAPIEQYAGDSANLQGPWTDLYGWGASAYFALAGKPPPPAASRVMHDSIVKLVDLRPPGYTHDMLAAIDATLAVRPDDRPQSVADLKMLLAIQTPANLLPEPRAAVPVRFQVPRFVPDTDVPAAEGTPIGTADDGTSAHNASAVGALPARVDSDPDAGSSRVDASRRPAVPQASRSQSVSPAGAGGQRLALVLIAALLCAGVVLLLAWSGSSRVATEAATATSASGASGASGAARTAPKSSGNPVNGNTMAAIGGGSDASASAARSGSSLAAAKAEPGAAAASADAAMTGKPATARFAIKPWGEVLVNGERRGVSPPLKALSLPPGEYLIEIRNGEYAPHRAKIKLAAGQVLRIGHAFGDGVNE